MFKVFLYCILLLGTFCVNAQFNGGSISIRSDGRLIDLFESIKNRTNAFKSNTFNKIEGSPYFETTFKSAEIKYFEENLKDNVFIRYNAFSDEMEVGTNPNQQSADNVLIKNNKVYCIIDGDVYRYLAYTNENDPPAVGYVKELFRGKVFSLFERKSKIYMEATIAKTSLERAFPARFIEKINYYYSVENGSLMRIKLSKKKLISALKSYTDEIKSFISNSDSKLKSPNEVIKLFKYLEAI